MKQTLSLLVAVSILFSACKKTTNYTIVANKMGVAEAKLKLDDLEDRFNSDEMQKNFSVDKHDVVLVSLSSSSSERLSLDLRHDGQSVGSVNGTGYISMIINNEGVSSTSGGSSGSGTGTGGSGGGGSSGGSGSGCTSVQCSGTTQAGNRCQRTTTNCSGRCWQH